MPFVVLNRAGLVVAASSAVQFVRETETGAPIITAEEATAIYASDNNTFYPLATPGGQNWNAYHVEEVETVPAEVVPGFWYFNSPEFYTTPEREAALLADRARAAAPAAASIAFVALAEAGQIDPAAAGENAAQFAEWAYPIDYKAGNIRRYGGALYRCISEHTSQSDWTPASAVSLWSKIADPSEEWPEWAQPVGAFDAYDLGAKVTHNGVKWLSITAANVWEPGVYGWEAAET